MIQKYINKLVERIRNIFDKDAGKKEIYPERDWYYVIIIFIVFSFSLSVFYYYKLGKNIILPEVVFVSKGSLTPELSVEKITKSELGKMMSVWEVKQKKFDDYISNKPNFDSLR